MTDHYFGAYLQITVTKSLATRPMYMICPNGHQGKQGTFCSECGDRTKHPPSIMEYPTLIDHLLDDEKWEDVLAIITPDKICKSGIIIAIANSGGPGGDWLGDEDPYLKSFPSQHKILMLMKRLRKNYAEIIAALENCPAVRSVEILAGYVRCGE